MGYRRVLRYFFPPRSPLHRVPRHYAELYELQYADKEQLRLIENGCARTPRAASKLMEEYKADRAADVIKMLPPTRRISFWRRLQLVLMKYSGEMPYLPKERLTDKPIQLVKYRFMDE